MRDARGMFGERLGVDVHLVTAASGAMRNLQVCVRRAHLEIADRVVAATPPASPRWSTTSSISASP